MPEDLGGAVVRYRNLFNSGLCWTPAAGPPTEPRYSNGSSPGLMGPAGGSYGINNYYPNDNPAPIEYPAAPSYVGPGAYDY